VVEVESTRKTIQHLEGGIIGKILVKDGDKVAAGQVLIRLDDTQPRTTLVALQGQLWDAKAREARLLAERDGRDAIAFPADLDTGNPTVAKVVAGQQKIFETRRSLQQSKTQLIKQRIAQVKEEIVGLKAQVSAADRRIVLIKEEIADSQQLMKKGLARKPHVLDLQGQLAEIQGKRGETVAQIARAEQTIAESEVSIINLKNDTQNEVANDLRDTQKKIHELTEKMQAARDVLSRIEVRAPEAGIITNLQVHTPGGVISAGEPLMDLVPESDRLIVTAQVRPEDINVVHEGLPAQVQLIPYKTRRTPPVDGKVIYVSADRLTDKRTGQPYYAAKIQLDEKELAKSKDIDLVPGMPGEVMIKTGETTVALYALAPIIDSFHRAFRESDK
jgi:HlyD family secretion protein